MVEPGRGGPGIRPVHRIGQTRTVTVTTLTTGTAVEEHIEAMHNRKSALSDIADDPRIALDVQGFFPASVSGGQAPAPSPPAEPADAPAPSGRDGLARPLRPRRGVDRKSFEKGT
ncbi:hypothetical protein ACIBI9_52920 [Nonomuraea sp. NPDC050451]|uniref:hypothetical protein n=1 Tax=Nonomuraea sp. NPDC050451 TaxID=3364364 RepID=UPI0037887C06